MVLRKLERRKLGERKLGERKLVERDIELRGRSSVPPLLSASDEQLPEHRFQCLPQPRRRLSHHAGRSVEMRDGTHP